MGHLLIIIGDFIDIFILFVLSMTRIPVLILPDVDIKCGLECYNENKRRQPSERNI